MASLSEFSAGEPCFHETHSFAHNDTQIIFSANPDAGQSVDGTDLFVLDRISGTLARRVTDTPGEWDEHAHPVHESGRLIWTTSRDITWSGDPPVFHVLADYWVEDSDGEAWRLTRFSDEIWAPRPTEIPPRVFASDFSLSPDRQTLAAFIQVRDPGAYYPILLIQLTEPL